MPKLIWGKKLKEAAKLHEGFAYSINEMKSWFFVQRCYPDINKRFISALTIRCETNQELNVLNALEKINEVMRNSGCSLNKVIKVLYGKIITRSILIKIS